MFSISLCSGFGPETEVGLSQVEDGYEAGDVMDLLEDDEMMRQSDAVSMEEENIIVRKMKGRSLQVEGVQKMSEFFCASSGN